MRMTIPTQLVLERLCADPERAWHGYELGRTVGLASGTIHPILARIESQGWVVSEWERLDPREAGRPPRRYYRLTESGVREASAALASARRRARPTWATAPEPGGAT